MVMSNCTGDLQGEFPSAAQFGCDFGMVKSQDLLFNLKMRTLVVSKEFFKRIIAAENLIIQNEFAHIMKKVQTEMLRLLTPV